MRLLTTGTIAALFALTATAFAADPAAPASAAPASAAPAPAAPAKMAKPAEAAKPATDAAKPMPVKKEHRHLVVKVEKTVPVQAGAVWTAIGDFCGIATWHPAIAKCVPSVDKKREIRTLTTKDGGTIVEKLGIRNAEAMTYVYALMSSPLPVAHYAASLSVAPTKDGKSAVITWKGSFDPAKGATKAQAIDAIKGIYTPGLDGLAAAAAKVQG